MAKDCFVLFSETFIGKWIFGEDDLSVRGEGKASKRSSRPSRGPALRRPPTWRGLPPEASQPTNPGPGPSPNLPDAEPPRGEAGLGRSQVTQGLGRAEAETRQPRPRGTGQPQTGTCTATATFQGNRGWFEGWEVGEASP